MTTVILPYPVMSVPRKSVSRVRRAHSPSPNERPFTSFLIKDILNKNTPGAGGAGEQTCGVPSFDFIKHKLCPVPRVAESIWVAREGLLLARPRPVNRAAVAAATVAFINEAKKNDKTAVLLGRESPDAPLTALEQLTTKTFTGLETSILKAAEAAASGGKRDSLHLLSRQAPRKKRKSRTAFTNHQIFELERRFLYQKYLTPADRDELASTLGLTNAQVITWFQNRRAKLKRDIDELKADLSTKEEEEAEMRSIGIAAKRKAGNDKQHMKIKIEKLHHLTQGIRSSLPPPLVASEDTKKQFDLRPEVDMGDFRGCLHDRVDGVTNGAMGGGRVSQECRYSDENELMDSELSDVDGDCHIDEGHVSDDDDDEQIDVENVVDSERHLKVEGDIHDCERYHNSSPKRSKSC